MRRIVTALATLPLIGTCSGLRPPDEASIVRLAVEHVRTAWNTGDEIAVHPGIAQSLHGETLMGAGEDDMAVPLSQERLAAIRALPGARACDDGGLRCQRDLTYLLIIAAPVPGDHGYDLPYQLVHRNDDGFAYSNASASLARGGDGWRVSGHVVYGGGHGDWR